MLGSPVQINSLLETRKIDIGLISSASYLSNRSSYILLSDYGIGAREKVLSVCLFCRQPNFDFRKAKTFLIPSPSATSSSLLKVLATHFWKTEAAFIETSLEEEALFHQDLPFLLIGDTCLQKHDADVSVCDLATEWHIASKKSFVFSLVATRNDTFIHKQEEALQFHKNLMSSYSWSKENRHEIVSASAEKLGISFKKIDEYFHALDYELLQDHIHGLDHFSSFKV